VSKNIQIKTLRTVILLAVVYGSENWTPILGQENKIRVLRKILIASSDKCGTMTGRCM
jgi:hypothetical protein